MRKIIGGIVLLCALIVNLYSDTKHYIDGLYTGISGFTISKEEVSFINSTGSDSTYGEIVYESVEALLKEFNLGKEDVFYDLGCGVGKMVVQVYLNSPVKKSIGLELGHTRVTDAIGVREKIEKDKKLSEKQTLAFYEEDITKYDYSDATVVYMASTLFSDDMMKHMTDKLAKGKNGLRVATLVELSKSDKFELVKKIKLAMTWSSKSTIYLYRLKG